MRRITHVAIQYKGKTYSLPAPNRHHHVIRKICAETGEQMGRDWQGFLDDTGKFVGRQEAVRIARAAGQIRIKTSPSYMLFSEDIW